MNHIFIVMSVEDFEAPYQICFFTDLNAAIEFAKDFLVNKPEWHIVIRSIESGRRFYECERDEYLWDSAKVNGL